MYALSRAAKRFSSAGVGSWCWVRLGGSGGSMLTFDVEEFAEFLVMRGGRGGGGGGTVAEPEPGGADVKSGRGSSAGIFSS
jgi:hypothetical protein